ncbi:hypothetical protein SLEP1_g17844 [Rubroshorea leprosula]|uniref:BHLH domain-containing protein n=1 Tax=Rubroshorea leprosula TaxID=152421 RepID=A0AAV5J1G7_9ROSI|nr:hypothetical protein SLEP1_g17844 [Rubroshorea leprosula]
MGTTALRQLLKSLCSNSPWKYAVLWKLRHWSPLILTWEDGYCVYPGPREPVESMSYGIYSNHASDIISSCCESNFLDGGLGGYPIGLLVANMSNLQYAWGEGVIGKVAQTGKHCWVSYDDILGKDDSRLFAQCPEEWLLQFMSGIKIIVLIPVLPYGVLQLGSLEMVPEDLAVISYVKDRFTHHTAGGNTTSLSFNRNVQAQSLSPLISSLVEKLDESSTTSTSPHKSEDSRAVDSVKPNSVRLLTSDQVVTLLDFQNPPLFTGQNLTENLVSASEPNFGSREVSSPPSQSMKASQPEMESKLFGMSCLEEDLLMYLASNNYSLDEYGDFLTGIMNSNHTKDFAEEPFGEKNINDVDLEAWSSFFSFPKHCELHKALGPAFQKQSNEYLCDLSTLGEDAHSKATHRDLAGGIEPSSSIKGDDAEYLLQAVVANRYSGTEDTSSNESSGVKSSIASTGHKAVTSRSPRSRMEVHPTHQAISAFVSKAKNDFNAASSPSLNSTVSTLIDGEQLQNGNHHTQPRKGTKPPNISKRRTRPADSQRPRPRDRQLIQDRVKELRDLVPNGAKCSIDGLLDQTIKHMLYLRSMTNQAEKLRQWVHQEVAGRKNLRSLETKDGHQKGTSWAFEIGGEMQVCPIVVEDLPYPGHLLIEMLCSEQGMFLEIAQVIRSFNLTILKGVMESSENNTWAHFIVEASRGFHRLDIFWPLMQLLQRRRNPVSSKISCAVR